MDKKHTFSSGTCVIAGLDLVVLEGAGFVLIFDFDCKYLFLSDAFLTSFFCSSDLTGLPLGFCDIVRDQTTWFQETVWSLENNRLSEKVERCVILTMRCVAEKK